MMERWQRVEQIFQAALDRSPEERAAFLAEACAHDVHLKRDVEVLLSQYESGADIGYGSVFDDSDLTGDPMIGRRLGSYRIERQIGRGGMGTVYEAARDDKEF